MYIDTGKGKMPVRYGWNAYAKFGDLTGKSMNDVLGLDLKTMSPSDILAFIYVGFLIGAKYEGEECKVKDMDEVGDMLDEDPTIISRMMAVYADDSKGDESKEESKKK